MWYPTKHQWLVIWIVTVLCMIGWLSSDPAPAAFVMPAVLVLVLFVWHASADFGRNKESSKERSSD